MKTIWKFNLGVLDTQTLFMPKDAEILSIQFQDGGLCVWALVETDNETVGLPITIVGTGQSIRKNLGAFIATVQQPPFVWHVFESVPRFRGSAKSC